MLTLKTLIKNRFEIISLLISSMVLSIILLMIRVKITHSFFFMFLVWNLFLAVIPYTITTYLLTRIKIKKISILFWFSIWLMFLPNAPYIITDLFHLRLSNPKIIWLDVLVISSFASSGLLLFFLTLTDMKQLLIKHISIKKLKFIMPFIIYLSSFGMYLGRFLRYNSWEIIQNPITLFKDILNIILIPSQNNQAWLFTLGFGSFLSIGFLVFKNITITQNPSK